MTRKKEIYALAVIFSFILAIIIYCFRANPASWFDEGIYQQIANNMALYGRSGLQLAPGEFSEFDLISVGYSVLYPAAAVFRLVGNSFIALRVLAVFFLVGFVIAFYLVARRLYGQQAALWSTAFLATFSPLYGHGKNFLGEVPGLFYLTWSLFAILALDRSRRPKLMAVMAGLLAGCALAAKPIYILLIPAFALAFVWRAKIYFCSRTGLYVVGFFSLGFIFTSALWVITQFGFNASLTTILTHYGNPNLVNDVWSQISVNAWRFLSESTPLHFLVLSCLAVVAVMRAYRKQNLHLIEIVIFIFAMASAISYLRTVGWYRYLFHGQVLLFLFVPSALDRIAHLLIPAEKWRKFALPICGIILLLAQIGPIITERLVCVTDAPTALAQGLENVTEKQSVFFYNLPHIAARFSGKNYYQYVEMNPNVAFGKENIKLVRDRFFDYLVLPDAMTALAPQCYTNLLQTHGVVVYQKNSDCQLGQSNK